jgi:hypothetical protein
MADEWSTVRFGSAADIVFPEICACCGSGAGVVNVQVPIFSEAHLKTVGSEGSASGNMFKTADLLRTLNIRTCRACACSLLCQKRISDVLNKMIFRLAFDSQETQISTRNREYFGALVGCNRHAHPEPELTGMWSPPAGEQQPAVSATCWFCDRRGAEPTAGYAYSKRSIIHEGPPEEWISVSASVPRCQTCADIQKKYSARGWQLGFGGAVVAVAVILAISWATDQMPRNLKELIAAVLLGACGGSGIGVALSRYSARRRYKCKLESDASTSFVTSTIKGETLLSPTAERSGIDAAQGPGQVQTVVRRNSKSLLAAAAVQFIVLIMAAFVLRELQEAISSIIFWPGIILFFAMLSKSGADAILRGQRFALLDVTLLICSAAWTVLVALHLVFDITIRYPYMQGHTDRHPSIALVVTIAALATTPLVGWQFRTAAECWRAIPRKPRRHGKTDQEWTVFWVPIIVGALFLVPALILVVGDLMGEAPGGLLGAGILAAIGVAFALVLRWVVVRESRKSKSQAKMPTKLHGE